jgi:hypothetical protein
MASVGHSENLKAHHTTSTVKRLTSESGRAGCELLRFSSMNTFDQRHCVGCFEALSKGLRHWDRLAKRGRWLARHRPADTRQADLVTAVTYFSTMWVDPKPGSSEIRLSTWVRPRTNSPSLITPAKSSAQRDGP